MNLDDISAIKALDTQNMLAELRALPGQLEKAWVLGRSQCITRFDAFNKIVVAGLGGSAIGADLGASYLQIMCDVPIVVLRDYRLPSWAQNKDTLVICSSHSGNTEETLSIFEHAAECGCQQAVITTGGELKRKAELLSIPVLVFEHHSQPRAAVGFSFGLFISLMHKLGLIPDQTDAVREAVSVMKELLPIIDLDNPVVKNPAKRMAGQAIGRYVSIFAAEPIAPVARRWKTQINELAKSWAQFEYLPEADHNTIAGILVPEKIMEKIYAIFLSCDANHPRNILRLEKTKQVMMVNGLSTDSVAFSQGNVLAQIWNAVLFGDFVAYYLAVAYNMDPTPIEAIASLKKAMQ